MLSLRPIHVPPAALVPVLAATLLAGCGSSSPPRRNSGGPSAKSFVADAYKFAACMRTHGVSNFPDPQVHNGGQQISIHVVGNPRSRQFTTAQKDCAGILPAPTNGGPNSDNSAAHARALLAFARCLRTHGFPSFPDPDSQGRLTLQMITAAGINLHQPATLRAGDACVGVTHGVITAANVAQAVNGTVTTGSSASASGSGG